MGESSSFKQVRAKRRIILSAIGFCAVCVLGYVIFFAGDPDERQARAVTSKIDKLHDDNLQFIRETRQSFGLKPEFSAPSGGDSPDAKAELSPEKKKEMVKLFQKRRKENRQRMREIREEIKKLSPETRKKVVKTMMRSQLDQARRQSAHLSYDDKKKIVDDMIQDIHRQSMKLTPEQREKRKERFNSPEGKQRVKENLDFYMNELSAKERELLDPLAREVLKSIDEL